MAAQDAGMLSGDCSAKAFDYDRAETADKAEPRHRVLGGSA